MSTNVPIPISKCPLYFAGDWHKLQGDQHVLRDSYLSSKQHSGPFLLNASFIMFYCCAAAVNPIAVND